jgi:hypothetical protein
LVTIEWWVEVDEADALAFDVLSKDLKIVVAVSLVHGQPICAYQRWGTVGNASCPIPWHNGIIMPKGTSKKSKPADISQLARAIGEEVTGESHADRHLSKEPTKESTCTKYNVPQKLDR